MYIKLKILLMLFEFEIQTLRLQNIIKGVLQEHLINKCQLNTFYIFTK